MNQPKPLYFENLDGLRAIAAIAVILAHISYWFQYPDTIFFNNYRYILSFGGSGGRLGVIFFFVLSGFLITYLLFQEQQKNKKINVLFFYMRRVLRIWPLYFVTLIIGFIVYPFLMRYYGIFFHENASLLMYSLFLANFDHIHNVFPSSNILGVQWSVSVEEQFYLLWPLLFLFFSKRKYFPGILLLLICISELFSFFIAYKLNAGDYHLLSCLKYLAIGALLAYYCFYKKEKVSAFCSKITKSLSILIYTVCISILFMQQIITENFDSYKKIYHVIPMLFFCFVIIEQNFSSNSFFKISRISLLTWLGKISYGLYLTHMIALNIVIALFTNGGDYVLLKSLLTLLLTISISYISYISIEKYFLFF